MDRVISRPSGYTVHLKQQLGGMGMLQVSLEHIPKWHWCHEGGKVGGRRILGTGSLESSSAFSMYIS